MLRAEGCVPAILGRDPGELRSKSLVKIGFSNFPDRRCAEHNSTLPPASKFRWKLILKSRAFPDGAAAKAGEDRLKAAFDSQFESLGGEFFLGDLATMETQFVLVPGVGFRLTAPAIRVRGR
jgi:hypothetical protein